MVSIPGTLSAAAIQVLETPEPARKVALTHAFAAYWRDGQILEVGNTEQANPPDRPPTPSRPVLLLPRDMPRRPKVSTEGRVAFIHAIAHIEYVAINLAWDIIVRFTHENLPREFFDDWVGVAHDEADHFNLLQNRLK